MNTDVVILCEPQVMVEIEQEVGRVVSWPVFVPVFMGQSSSWPVFPHSSRHVTD